MFSILQFDWSWAWLFISIIAAVLGFVLGKTSGKQDGGFASLLLENLIAGLPNLLEAEYEIAKISPGRVKLTVRVLVKEQENSGKWTTTEQELNWHDLPSEIRADMIRSRSEKHIRSLYSTAADRKEK